MLDLRYRFDPIDTGFHGLLYGEACLNWYKAVAWDVVQLSANLGFAIGSELLKSPRKAFQVTGRRFWGDCIGDFRNIWGDEDSDVKEVKAVLDTCIRSELSTDVMVCSYIDCVNPVEDRVGSTPKLLCCGQCHLAYYCDKNCQRSDWKIHKKVCMFVSPVYGLKDLKERISSIDIIGTKAVTTISNTNSDI